jgi:hypothetical protein
MPENTKNTKMAKNVTIVAKSPCTSRIIRVGVMPEAESATVGPLLSYRKE